ncbi:MAG: hypothetical protein ISR65_01680 [Bacteriovoracaceae bacterium]|nr:hypothetical protein [Bacteriovoracaceae bacterium]
MSKINIKIIAALIIFNFSLVICPIKDLYAMSICEIAATALIKSKSTLDSIKVTDILRTNAYATMEVANYIRSYKSEFDASKISSTKKIQNYIASVKSNEGAGASYLEMQTVWKMNNRFQRLMNNRVFDKELIDALNNRRQQLFVEELASLLGTDKSVANFKNYRSIEGITSGTDLHKVFQSALKNSGKKFDSELLASLPTVMETFKKQWQGSDLEKPSNWYTVASHETEQFGFFERQLLDRLSKRAGATRRTMPNTGARANEDVLAKRLALSDRRVAADRTKMVEKAIEDWSNDYDNYNRARLSVAISLSSTQIERGVFQLIEGTSELSISEGCAHVIRKVQTTGSEADRTAAVTKAMNKAYRLNGEDQLTTAQINQLITVYDKLDALLLSVLKAEGMPSAPAGDFIHFAVDVKMAGALNIRVIAQELARAKNTIEEASTALSKVKAIHQASMNAEKIATVEMDRSIDNVIASLQDAYGDNVANYVHNFIPTGADRNTFYVKSGDDVFIYFFDTTDLSDIKRFTDSIAKRKIGHRARTASGLIKTDAEKGEDLSKQIEVKAMNLWGPQWQQNKEIVFYVHVENGDANLIISGEDATVAIQEKLTSFFKSSTSNL